MYQIQYSKSFAASLSKTINYWEKQLKLSDKAITKYVSLIYRNINLLSEYPYISEDVSKKYHFNKSTYRITIGNQYCIFYRVDEHKKIVQIGSLFNNRQMRIKF
ncbi:hypothetical protein GCM10022297_15620 [Lactobacillus hamsteri]|uniref:Type II toxin-antitoxin system RelE/ParE family toxin n=1 Tax=Lactobacillus hamsteri DSM 5661 = JCM 6256 TaxID=1423754 RepID=A0A0R1YL98_9LACO|nr:type II toxin-antitoxin system RelE/ParE family toxin [Lactobacillus hamsteri]KRM40731.1 hypothetical protein FC39_GL000215 [Lactobacillus hamsteri DSM 5661 = JCM 6256]